jgi:hypothetical protein
MLQTGTTGDLTIMTIQYHALEIYEPYDYHGDNPLSVSGVAILVGPMRDNYYLVQLQHPFVIDQEDVTQLLVQPRYNDDKIDRAVGSTCTVNIARVVSKADLSQVKRLAFDDFQRWGVGKISPPT